MLPRKAIHILAAAVVTRDLPTAANADFTQLRCGQCVTDYDARSCWQNGSWSTRAWADLWNTVWFICDQQMIAGPNVQYTYDVKGNAVFVHLQQVLQPGMSNEHSTQAYEAIVGACFNSAHSC